MVVLNRIREYDLGEKKSFGSLLHLCNVVQLNSVPVGDLYPTELLVLLGETVF